MPPRGRGAAQKHPGLGHRRQARGSTYYVVTFGILYFALQIILDGRTYTADQIRFVSYIIDHLTQNGTLDPALLYDHPFTDIHYAGPDGIFTNTQTDTLLKVLVGVNNSVQI